MATEVMLSTPYRGMTVAEYEDRRELDCRVALGMGWTQERDMFNNLCLWIEFPGDDQHYRDDFDEDDDPRGVPFYSTDMAHTYPLLQRMAKWNYLAQQKFWQFLQERGAWGEGVPEYPDCLIALIPELPLHICSAFADTYDYHAERQLDPMLSTQRAQDFATTVQTEQTVEIDKETGREIPRLNARPTCTPWVVAEGGN